MPDLDKRFALIRDGQAWFASRHADRDTRHSTFRVSKRGESRDAHKQSEHLTDIETVARKVLLEGCRMRCMPDSPGARASSLDLVSKGVTGYVLDATLALRLGIPERR